MKCLPAVVALLLLLPAGLPAQAPTFEWSGLPDDLPQTLRDSVRFGYVEVPEDHDRPDGPRIRLAVALLPALSSEKASDPLVFVFGGPGWAAIRANLANLARLPQFRLYRERRDVVLLDQRGHGYSGPERCSVNLADNIDGISEGAQRKYLASLEECRSQLQERRVRLEALSAAQSARDLEWLRVALGASALNLYAASYGAVVAAAALQRVPATIRAVHFASPLPPGKVGIAGGDYTIAAEALEALLRRCAAQTECATAYPRLAADLEAVLSEMERRPLRVPVPAHVDVEGAMVVNDVLLRIGLSQLLANRRTAARAPFIIHALAEHGVAESADLLRQIGGPMEGEEDGALFARETMLAFWCNDGTINRTSPEWRQQRCRVLLGEAYTGHPAEPVESDVPALVTAGEWDPRTPPSYARALATRLARSHVVIIPMQGHERLPDCVFGISRAFLDAPERAPDTTCLASIPRLRFFTADER